MGVEGKKTTKRHTVFLNQLPGHGENSLAVASWAMLVAGPRIPLPPRRYRSIHSPPTTHVCH